MSDAATLAIEKLLWEPPPQTWMNSRSAKGLACEALGHALFYVDCGEFGRALGRFSTVARWRLHAALCVAVRFPRIGDRAP